jgi:hypothetical protein
MLKWKYLVFAVLALGVIYQVVTSLGQLQVAVLQTWKTLGKPAVWRGVNFSAGQNFAGYVEFLNRVVPLDALVILPPEGARPPVIGRTPYMQFFLAPRRVVNCTGENPECAAGFSVAGAYVLVARRDGFPSADLLQDQARVRMFNQDLGVLLPYGAQPANLPVSGNASLLQIVARLLVPLVWLAALAASGVIIVAHLTAKSTASHADPLSRLALGFGIGLGGFTLLLYLALLTGIGLSRALILFLTLLCMGVGTGFYLKTPSPRLAWSLSRWDWLYLFLLAMLSALVTFLAVGQGYHWSDEVVLWGAKGYGIAAAGLSAGAAEWGTRTTAYPLHLPLSIASFRALFGDQLPQSKMIFPMYYFSLLVLVYSFLSRSLKASVSSPGRSSLVYHLAGGSALLLGLAPLVLTQGALSYANLPLAFYLLAALLCAIWALEAIPGSSKGLWWLSGVCFALAAWTRPEGLVLSLLSAVLVGILLVIRTLKHDRVARTISHLIGLFTPLLLYTLLWLLTASRVYPSAGWVGQVFQVGLAQAARGNLNLDSAQFVLNSFLSAWFDHDTWGLLGFTMLLLFIGFLMAKARFGAAAILVGAGLLCLAAILGMYLLIANDPSSNISWWVDTGLNRMLAPGMILLWVGSVDWAITAIINQPSPSSSPESPQ